MTRPVTLSQYVQQRNGVPLGASHSLRNMLLRAFGARSFPVFWHYWNPIWGYYLSRFVMRPLRNVLPLPAAILITFLVSGAMHDVVVSLVHGRQVIFFTPWFGVMGAVVIGSHRFALGYGHYAWLTRASINLVMIIVTLAFTDWMLSL